MGSPPLINPSRHILPKPEQAQRGKHSAARNKRVEECFARASMNGRMGYARAIPDGCVDGLPKAQLLPRLRRRARRWMHAAKGRKRQRVDRFLEDRAAGATAGGAAPAAGAGGDGSDSGSALSAGGSSGSSDSGGSSVQSVSR